MSQYIGKTISLISSKGIRYVGTLSNVNGEEATVTLQNVKPFGTEGRIGDPTKEIPAVDDVYPVVVFRGSDVRDLSVLDEAPADSVPKHVVPEQKYEPVKEESSDEEEEEEEEEEQEQKAQPHRQERVYQHRPQQRPYDNFANAAVPDADFDFTKLSDSKDDLQRDKDVVELEEPAYDKKKSFFDNISNSATEKYSHQRQPQQRADFGTFDNGRPRPDFGGGNRRPDFGNNNRRGGRGGNRGGRGGYRGQWSNDNSNNDYGSY